MRNVAEETAVRPSSPKSTMRPVAPTQTAPANVTAAPMLRGAAPLDTSDPVDGILLEAGASLELVLDVLENAHGAGVRGSGLDAVFTSLLAVRRRLAVARELRSSELSTANDARSSLPHASTANGADEEGTSDEDDVIAGTLWEMRESVRALSAVALRHGDEDAIRHLTECEAMFHEANTARRKLGDGSVRRAG